jgi:hypothetical protein
MRNVWPGAKEQNECLLMDLWSFCLFCLWFLFIYFYWLIHSCLPSFLPSFVPSLF